MSIFNDIVDEIKLTLSNASNLSDVKFVNSDLNENIPNPIKKTCASICISSIDINSGSLNSYLGHGENGDLYGSNADLILSLKIISPTNNGVRKCYTVFSNIYENLQKLNNNYTIKNVSCSQTKYNSDIFSFELNCTININVFIAYESEDINISSIQVTKTI